MSNARSLTDAPIVRLFLDGTVVFVRLDKNAMSISLLVILGVRADGQKVLLAIKNINGESEAAWRDLVQTRLVDAGVRHHRRCARCGKGACDIVVGCSGSTLHGA
jgi:putative transposase